jgi:TonB family protein
MKKFTALAIAALLISIAGLACQNNPFTAGTKQYKCEISGQPDPVTADDFLKRGFKHYADNNFENDEGDCALNACSEAVRLDPKSADAYYCRATMYRDKGERDNAIADMNEAINLKPDNAAYYGLRALVYADTNAYDKALADMLKKIELLKSEATHYDYNSRGDFYFELGKYDDALKDYSEAIRLKPDYQYHYADRANVYEKLGKNDLAAADKKKFEELDLAEKNKSGGEASGEEAKTNVNRKSSGPDTVSGGNLNEKAVFLPTPVYPATARAVKASGAVNVQVVIDESGDVIDASATSGHPLLKAAAVQAARAAKFRPTLMGGKPVKVNGILVFNFTPSQ